MLKTFKLNNKNLKNEKFQLFMRMKYVTYKVGKKRGSEKCLKTLNVFVDWPKTHAEKARGN
jgi:hypothetical protein